MQSLTAQPGSHCTSWPVDISPEYLAATEVRWGGPANFTPAVIAKGQAAMQTNARDHQTNRQAARLAELLRAKGHTLQQVADELNQAGYRTRRGRTFHPTTVQRLLPVQHNQANEKEGP